MNASARNSAGGKPNADPGLALRVEVDSYIQTVRGIVGLIHELAWDDTERTVRADIRHRHGAEHSRSGGEAVTPDFSIQAGDDFAVVGDVKIGFATSEEGREKISAQLLKYDDAVSSVLANGRTTVREGSTVLLTHNTRKVDASDYLANKTGFQPVHPFAVVAVSMAEQAAGVFIQLERSYGTVVPRQKDEKLRRVVAIRLDHLVSRYGSVTFYDAAPPLLYVVEVMWDLLFSALVSEEAFTRPPGGSGECEDEGGGAAKVSGRAARRGAVPLDVEPEAVADRLRRSFSLRVLDQRLPGAPRTEAVKGALDLLVELDLAERLEPARDSDGTGSRYRVHYRNLRKGTRDFFVRKLVRLAERRAGVRSRSKQLALFKKE